jgi:hypothetical protein
MPRWPEKTANSEPEIPVVEEKAPSNFNETVTELQKEDAKVVKGKILATYYSQSKRLRVGGLSRESRFSDGSVDNPEGACQFENNFFQATSQDEVDCIERSKSFQNGKDVVKVDDNFMAKYMRESAAKRLKVSPRQTNEVDMSYLAKE